MISSSEITCEKRTSRWFWGESGSKAGFYVIRTDWSTTCGRLQIKTAAARGSVRGRGGTLWSWSSSHTVVHEHRVVTLCQVLHMSHNTVSVSCTPPGKTNTEFHTRVSDSYRITIKAQITNKQKKHLLGDPSLPTLRSG